MNALLVPLGLAAASFGGQVYLFLGESQNTSMIVAGVFAVAGYLFLNQFSGLSGWLEQKMKGFPVFERFAAEGLSAVVLLTAGLQYLTGYLLQNVGFTPGWELFLAVMVLPGLVLSIL